MKRSLAVLAAGLFLFSGTANAQFFVDQFDTYATGPLAAQSLWEEWSGSSGVDAQVVDLSTGLPVEFTPANAVRITGQPIGPGAGNDVVWDFTQSGGQPTSGQYICSTRVYVPSTANGVGWFIMLNTYPSGNNWSVQLNFDASAGSVVPVEPAGTTLPLIYDDWVDLILTIDLDSDRVDIWYGTDALVTAGPWIGNGAAQIACIDLYGGEPASGGISEFFYDNIRMEKVPKAARAGFALVTSPGPVPDGTNVNFDIVAPRAKNGIALLFVTAVSGNPFVQKVLTVPLDANGEFSASGPVGPGLSGIDIDLWSLGLKGTSLLVSNINKIVIQ